jgi:hypothetical protein
MVSSVVVPLRFNNKKKEIKKWKKETEPSDISKP